ncbi:hypothetical protein CDAR_278061 [Caerostris darwini]|uniref:Uncharacterized protein n=1 Tax=Caerostris darwini TaxID=1538125 RepID=A0AAV4SAT6_9ARAC|nr:hypothetical protein CDAR_278061 [Caerostris darwini]
MKYGGRPFFQTDRKYLGGWKCAPFPSIGAEGDAGGAGAGAARMFEHVIVIPNIMNREMYWDLERHSAALDLPYASLEGCQPAQHSRDA